MFHRVWRAALSFALCILPLALFPACVEENSDPIPNNLLVSAKVENSGVPNTSRLVDGEVPVEGDPWDSAITARFESASGSVTWDLGAVRSLRGALVQGDNNDIYVLSGSADGKVWNVLWEAPPVEGAGMRMRQTDLSAGARYVRVTGKGGDQLYSIGEIALFTELPKGWPKLELARVEGIPPAAGGEAASSWSVSLGVLVAAAAVLMLLSRKRRPPEGTPPAEAASTGTPPAP
jgi:LPXTG-motif cell wall-anchored protein